MPHDTTRQAALAQVEAWRRMGPAKTAELALSFSDEIRSNRLDALRKRHRGLSENEYVRLLIRELYGVNV